MNLDAQTLTAAAKGYKLALAGSEIPADACQSMRKGYLRGQSRLKSRARENFELIKEWKISK